MSPAKQHTDNLAKLIHSVGYRNRPANSPS